MTGTALTFSAPGVRARLTLIVPAAAGPRQQEGQDHRADEQLPQHGLMLVSCRLAGQSRPASLAVPVLGEPVPPSACPPPSDGDRASPERVRGPGFQAVRRRSRKKSTSMTIRAPTAAAAITARTSTSR